MKNNKKILSSLLSVVFVAATTTNFCSTNLDASAASLEFPFVYNYSDDFFDSTINFELTINSDMTYTLTASLEDDVNFVVSNDGVNNISVKSLNTDFTDEYTIYGSILLFGEKGDAIGLSFNPINKDISYSTNVESIMSKSVLAPIGFSISPIKLKDGEVYNFNKGLLFTEKGNIVLDTNNTVDAFYISESIFSYKFVCENNKILGYNICNSLSLPEKESLYFNGDKSYYYKHYNEFVCNSINCDSSLFGLNYYSYNNC